MLFGRPSHWWLLAHLAAAGAAAWWYGDYVSAESGWHAYRAGPLARGAKLSALEFFAADPIRDERNFAASPMWRKWQSDPQAARSFLPVLHQPPAPSQRERKSRGMPRGAFDLSAWRRAMIKDDWLPANDTQGSDAEAVLRGLQRIEPILRELHEDAQRPACQFPPPSTDRRQELAPFFAPSVKLTKFLALKIDSHLQSAQPDFAFSAWQDGMALARAFDSSPLMIQVLVSVSIEGEMLKELGHGLGLGVWTDEQLRLFESQLRQLNPVARFARGLEGERAWFNSVLESSLESRDVTGYFNTSLVGLKARFLLAGQSRSWWRHLQESQDQGLAGQRDCCHPDTATWDRPHAVAVQQQARTFWGEDAPEMFGTDWVSFGERCCWFHLAQIRLARLGCALERYRRAHHEYPATLADLAPAFLDAVPGDPCTARPFVYRRAPTGGYVLYSVGKDGHDDGGAQSQPFVMEAPDWPWPSPAP